MCGDRASSAIAYRRTSRCSPCRTPPGRDVLPSCARAIHVEARLLTRDEPVGGPTATPLQARVTPALRRAFRGTLIVNGGYDARTGTAAIQSGAADLVAFGVPFLANPDLPQRLQVGAPLNPPDFGTFYAGEGKGYTDYPALAA